MIYLGILLCHKILNNKNSCKLLSRLDQYFFKIIETSLVIENVKYYYEIKLQNNLIFHNW